MNLDPRTLACARAAHEINRVWCIAIGDTSQRSWDDAEDWQRRSAIEGVTLALGGATPREQHEAWAVSKRRDGWVYGEIKDPAAKTHPCLVDYDALPMEQRVKDSLYIGTVTAMADAFDAAMG